MDAATEIALLESERLSWPEICARYLDQYVWLVNIVSPLFRSPAIITARVVGREQRVGKVCTSL